MKRKIFMIVGARPNFIKAAPVLEEFKKKSNYDVILIHTGQHYEKEMSECFFKELNLPNPDIYLGIGSGTHAEQTGRIMIEFEKVCLREKPDLVIVVGDVNSTIACALVAAKLCIRVAHIEAGLRSFDRTMPEEINRILTDQLSDYLFATCKEAIINLKREGIPENKVYFVGNTMIDTLKKHARMAKKSDILEKLGLRENGKIKKYLLLTLHRPSNVDNRAIFKRILATLLRLSLEVPLIFPIHPRTLKQIKYFGLEKYIQYIKDLSASKMIHLNRAIISTPPLGYLDFLCLMSYAGVVLTDSGGIQEETTILGVPCLTIRNNTERPITIKEGTNFLVGNSPEKIIDTTLRVLKKGIPNKRAPKYWDGKAAERIVNIMANKL